MNKSDSPISNIILDGDTLLSGQLLALSHPARRAILAQLAALETCCCGDVVKHLPLAQSTVSQHLKILVEAGLVTHRLKRPHSHYTLNREALGAVSTEVEKIVATCCPKQSSPRKSSD